MKLKKLFKNKLAFSLVELVVVIAIMAILAGAVAGAVVGVRDNANKTEVSNTAGELATQLSMIWSGQAMDKDGKTITVTKSTKSTDIKAWLETNLPGVTYETTQTAVASRTADTKYVLIPASTNYTTGVITFKVYTNKKTMDLKFNTANGAVEKGKVEGV